jgi:basic membrane protein A and related proteins
MHRLGVGSPGIPRLRHGAVLASCFGVIALAACGSSSTSSSGGGAAASSSKACTSTSSSGSGPWGWPGDATQGYLAPNEPDVDCDGKVTVGILSPGDTNDHGYYESFVDEAKTFAQQNGWQVITVDKINPADAVTQARNLCRQHVDMVAVAASELKDAIPVAQEDVCKGTVWYVAGGQGVNQTPYFVQSQDDANESGYASGYAAGLVMKAAGTKKAGFVTGPELDFAVTFAKAWYAGIKAVVPDATIVVTYTGSFDDSAKGVEAMKAQESQGIGIVYPYLGGATDAVTAEANKANIPSLTPGTNRCGGGTPSYAISVIFSPGDYFAAALGPFKAGTLRVGTARVWHMGVDPVPSVKICSPTGDQQTQVDNVIKQIGSGAIKPDDLAKATTLP